MDILKTVVVTILGGSLVAQATTWSSFTDRRGHAMARAQNGQVVTFGGQGTGSLGAVRGDASEFTQSGGRDSWLGLADAPEPRTEHAMASAQVNGQPEFIVFGGVAVGTGAPRNTTFRYRGGGWHDVEPPIGTQVPEARLGHGMVNHLGSHTVLLFGGYNGSQALNDLWEFLPAIDTWQERQPTGTPPAPRSEHCIAYCALNQKVYVYGGTPFQSDLHEYDLTLDSWLEKFPVGSVPPGRGKAAMAYVNGAGGILLFGGLRSPTVLGDTWRYDPLANQWTQLSFTRPTPPARYDHAVTIDGTGNRLVLLGGTDNSNSVFESTWQFDCNLLEWEETLRAPEPRTGVAMAYSSSRGRQTVFGGRLIGSGADTAETWELEGLNWRATNPSTPPPARSDAGLAFDINRGRTVLFGGRSAANGELGDTWEWNGTTWVPRSPAASPPALGGVPLVWSKASGKVLLPHASGVWSYDGSTWSRSGGPGPRSQFHCCWDEGRDCLVLFGGVIEGNVYAGDTWEWDGATWTRRATAGPSPRQSGSMQWDPIQQRVMLYGGLNASGSLSDAWWWDGSVWHSLGNAPWARSHAGSATVNGTTPSIVHAGGLQGGAFQGNSLVWDGSWTSLAGANFSSRIAPQVAYARNRQRLVLFGGLLSQSVASNAMLEHDGASWVAMAGPRPPDRAYGGMAYDSHTGTVLLFGGTNPALGSPCFDDTWTWNGTAWSQLHPTRRPAGRFSCALVDAGSRTLLFGGETTSGKVADLWEWTGTDWQELDGGNLPNITNFGAAYDERRDRVLVFGGMSSNVRATASYFAETWEWNGSRWLRLSPANSPPAMGWSKLSYDPTRDRIVLLGGADATNTYQDTWEWDGSTWLQRVPLVIPSGSYGHDLAFDEGRSLTVAYGAIGSWDYGPTSPAVLVAYGAGCETSGSAPTGAPLTMAPLPWAGPWLGDRMEVDFMNLPANSFGIFLWGFSDVVSLFGALPYDLGPIGSPNCYMLASSEVTEIMLPGSVRYTSFVLPNHPSLVGAVMYGQAGFFDSGSAGRIVTSNGIRMRFGEK